MKDHDPIRIERRLDDLRINNQIDGELDLVNVLGKAKFPFPIGLIVDGLLIRGTLSNAEIFSKAIDTQISQVLDNAFEEKKSFRSFLQGKFQGEMHEAIEKSMR